ncbi:MAG: carboxymuconolactone decarboxylase family protein [Terriglobia bacterium]
MRAYTQLSGAVYHGGALKAEEREMIATVVSALNHCHY